jgi:hypothetical protein
MKFPNIYCDAWPLLVSAWILSQHHQVGVNSEVMGVGLADPAFQDLFTTEVPNPLDPSFLYDGSSGMLQVSVSAGVAETGLKDNNGNLLSTPIWGYGIDDEIGHTWPGRTFVVTAGTPLNVHWLNKLSIVRMNISPCKPM